MRKILLLVLSLLLVSQFVSASLKIDKDDGWPVIVADSGIPGKATLYVTNLGETDNFEIYDFAGIDFAPKGTFLFEQGKRQSLPLEIYLPQAILNKNRGYFVFEYEFNSPKNGITSDKMQLKIVDLKDVFEVQPIKILPGDQEAMITIKNKEDTRFSDVKLEAKSSFFEGGDTFSVNPKSEVNITIPINQDKIKKLAAGSYGSVFDITLGSAKATLKPSVLYLEKSGLSVVESTEGAIIRTKTIKKTNEGNVNAKAEVSDERSIFTRLFTTQYPFPDSITKDGFYTNYTWTGDVSPGESFTVTITTNYTLPLIIVLFVLVGVFGVKLSLSRSIEAHKTVTFVKTKGGEFALRVTIRVKAKKHTDNVQIVDRLPSSMKLFAPSIKQGTYDSSTHRLTLRLTSLNQGEERVLSYVIYSKMNVVGKFELPATLVTYELDGKTQEIYSNTAYFVGDMMNREE